MDEPGMVLVLTVPFKDINGLGMEEIIEYIQLQVLEMRDTILTGLMENYFEGIDGSALSDPSGIN